MCPSHNIRAESIRRLYGPDTDQNPKNLYERLRAEHRPVTPVLVHSDLPS